MLRGTVDEQIHQHGRQARQHGQNALQVEEAQDEAKRPHAEHVRHPEIAHQFTRVVQAHAQTFRILRNPGDKAQLAEDVTQRGDGEEQYADTPFFFRNRLGCSLRFFAQHRELAAEGENKDRDINQTNAGVHPVPLNAARQKIRGDHRENHPGHAEEGVGEQQTRAALAAFIHVRNQKRTDRHGDPAHQAQYEHGGREEGDAVAQHQARHGGNHQHEAETQLRFQRHDFHQPGIKENRDQDPRVQEGEGITHAGNGQLEVVCDISHHHPGDDHQRAGQGVREEANPCELDAIAVSHVWPVKSKEKRNDCV